MGVHLNRIKDIDLELRTLTIRTAITQEVMIILQVTYDKMEWIEKILSRLERDFPQITSFQYVINGKKNDTFHDLDIICWKGNSYITEKMTKPDGAGELQFRVGPKSFYQTNSEQAYHLYRIAAGLARGGQRHDGQHGRCHRGHQHDRGKREGGSLC